MRLAHVSIEHFRGVRHFSTKLDATTVLIGENNCGKTSILDVIQRCLSAEIVGPQARFEPLDFHLPVPDSEHSVRNSGNTRRKNGTDFAPEPIRVRLAFTEEHSGAWPDSVRSQFAHVVHPRDNGCLTFVLAVEATASEAGAIDVSFRDRRDAAIPCDVAALHAALRRLKPVLRLNSRELFAQPCPQGAAPVTASSGAGAHVRESIDPDVIDRLVDLNAILIDPRLDDTDIHARLVELGRTLTERHDLPTSSGSPDRLLEALSRRLAEATDLTRRGRQLRLGTSTHGLVMVLLVASVVAARTASAADSPGDTASDPVGDLLSEPLLIIDDPEAHLHPTTLAFLGRVLRSVRAQKLVVTHSGDVLTSIDLHSIRRLHRVGGDIHNARLRERSLTAEDSRKIAYHVRARRGVVLFARCWLLVEGETEFWLMPAIAERLGYDLALESVALVEFAQCGVEPLIRVARDLGIEWHLLTDGDSAGRTYDASASELLDRVPRDRRITSIDAPDIEFSLWRGGFDAVYRRAAAGRDSISRRARRDDRPQYIIRRAIDATSKPYLARKIVEALDAPDAPEIPRQLRHAIEMAVGLARG